ncbi:MAG TPA: hypothetical protein VFS56_13035 [Gemmatimonadaceae bacterium]|nr:hypothetical protein [Gemmatimonadaceae bacterium]
MLTIISALSTEHGPAITVIAMPPMLTLGLTRTGRVDAPVDAGGGCAARRYGRAPSRAANPLLDVGRRVFN